MYEALASGVPVVGTRCGWTGELIQDGKNGFLVVSPAEIASAIQDIYENRSVWFDRRNAIRASLKSYSLDDWLEQNVRAAAALFRYSDLARSELALHSRFRIEA